MLRLVGSWCIDFRESVVLLFMTPGHFFVGLSFALKLLLPFGEFILILLGHIPSLGRLECQRKKTQQPFLWALGLNSQNQY
jgi:hypothetical protein